MPPFRPRVLALWLLGAAACGPSGGREAPSLGADPAPRLVREDRSDLPIEGLDAELAQLFARGDARFEAPFNEAEGLGPLYIQRACDDCHEDDLRGPGVVQRFVLPTPSPLGDTVRPRITAGARTALAAPEGARVSVRLPPSVIGRGYLEALDDTTIERWAAEQAARGGPISGRAVPIEGERAPAGIFASAPRVGRFGHKARTASLEAFVVDALQGDMGLTTTARPAEPANPDGLADDVRAGIDVDDVAVRELAAYVRLLALPSRAPADPRGAALFTEVGCADCHVPSARTRREHPIAALADREVALYTDVLVHDMGVGLEDGPEEQGVSAREWRTPPLLGLRFLRAFLHDGRAESVAAAIAAHGSEGSEARETVARFESLAEGDRATLVRFVEAL